MAVGLAVLIGTGVAPLLDAPTTASAAEVVPDSGVDAAAIDEAIERLRTRGLWLDHAAATDTALASPDAAMATFVGKAVFKSIIGDGVNLATDALLAQLGYDANSQLTAALADIHSSIDNLNAEVQRLSERIEQLLDGQDRTNFYNSYRDAGTARSRLSTALASVNGWIAADASPTPADVSDMQTIIRTSISDLAFVTTDATTGMIPLMMKAVEPSDVSDGTVGWDDIDTVRDDHRAVLAQGLVTLDLLLRWDTSGTVAADIGTLTPVASGTVTGMYDYGLAPTGPGGAAFVQHRHDDLALAGWQSSIPADHAATWRATTDPNTDSANALRRDVVEPILTKMANSYRPELHGGQTLEQYLTERGVPTKVVYTDTIRSAEVLHDQSPGRKFFLREVHVEIGEIVGNSYKGGTRLLYQSHTYSQGWSPFGGWYWEKPQREQRDAYAAEAAALVPVLRSEAANRTSAWQSRVSVDSTKTKIGDFHGRMLLGTTDNGAAGFHTDFDADRIRAAAIGDTD